MEGLLDSALGTIAAADFFTVGVWTRRGLQRFLLLFLIELSTRWVKIAGVAAQTQRAMDEAHSPK
jgi:hypothetical protein